MRDRPGLNMAKPPWECMMTTHQWLTPCTWADRRPFAPMRQPVHGLRPVSRTLVLAGPGLARLVQRLPPGRIEAANLENQRLVLLAIQQGDIQVQLPGFLQQRDEGLVIADHQCRLAALRGERLDPHRLAVRLAGDGAIAMAQEAGLAAV